MKRINSIDFTRGIVMIIMALDHVRDLIHIDSLTKSPTDLATTTPALFFTRWITHLCAPVFVFLAGTSVFISLQSKGDYADVRNKLIKRGFWLILLEFTIVNFGIYFDWRFNTILLGVIATIGCGFIVLSLLLKLRPQTIGIIGLVIILFYGLTTIIPFAEGSLVKEMLTPLFQTIAIPLSAKKIFITAYPTVPWLGIMMAGYGSGKFFQLNVEERKKIFLHTGLAVLLFFILLRFSNFYGDPSKWAPQRTDLYTFLSFINISKYPPSLLFCTLTLGIMFLILAFSEQFQGRFMEFITTYGRVPLFYFILHFYLIHGIMIAVMFLQEFQWAELDFASGTFGRPKGQESGLSLPYIYLIWIIVFLVLYRPCKWFARYKSTHDHWWLKYI